ncbi:receptor-interacting serine/threonine-protein kinase 3 [Bufo gargarizans]|uniref:receptor-interacting serine/threonine-protein kinase 3 n=1 Tax=Bufo gargarizans TaxID=30331 RepID=UPI001CF2BEEE|nr:receptor-interacting serine/threonine-protein kinase 3 [Bufo gargarizans]XP_044130774.1 receptor-interacting serine/threonine-protein kinase 3 [Bufo gargarizans]XP_044130783.1 receptor-interacting serine/threonine-protein kinase 3 [Bufo gargarizans]XP_044130791.1 receptor-interacting serine/threonine-protein kinase 3 [Bufo gargarizans]
MNKETLVPVTLLTDWVQIDQGHFGSVYKAKHKVFKVDVAVKKLKGNISQGLTDLCSEAEKMNSASASPFIIRLYGILKENLHGIPGIVMEYMENGSLYTLMERVNPIPWALKFRFIYEVTLGMNWLHNLSTPLLHLDLKTKNVLVDEGLHIKISDFGLSKYTSGPEDCNGVGGTLEYMPPEAFQEGYQPSASTDVYSFAILTVVVLRGESPYPVDKSVLIREHVSHGQRPCLRELEMEKSVRYLNEAIQFTKHCWDNDKSKRPPFSECCNKWETFFSAHEKDIRQAVRQVQDKMDSPVSSGNTNDISYKKDTASVNTKEMSDMVHRLHTLRFSEAQPALSESVPHKMPRQPPRVRPEIPPQGALGSHYRPKSMYYPESVPIRSSSQSQHLRGPQVTIPPGYPPGVMGPNYGHPSQYSTGAPLNWNQLFPPYYNFVQPATSNPTTINISGCTNFQIGDNTIMNVKEPQYSSPLRNMSYRQPVSTMRNHYFAMMRPETRQTTQGDYNTSAREAFPDQPFNQETVVKSDQESHIRPIQTSPEGHFSNARNPQQVAQGSMSTTEKPTTGQ